MLASMDVTSLYPSIDQQDLADIVRKTFLESDMKVDNVDYKAASLYLALTVSKEELEKDGLQQWVPRRTTIKGRKPMVRTSLMAGPLSREERTPNSRQEQNDPDLEDIQWEREE